MKSTRSTLTALLIGAAIALGMGCEDIDDAELFDDSKTPRLGEPCSSDNTMSCALYEAEGYTGSRDCTKEATQKNYTGSGYVNYGGKNSWIEWNAVNAKNSGKYALEFRYANGGAGDRSVAVMVDGKSVGNLRFEKTGSWTIWKTDSIQVVLQRGNHNIRVIATTSKGGPNLDRMRVIALETDNCPNDPHKTEPGSCGCGVPEGSCDSEKYLPYTETFDSQGGSFSCNKRTCSWTSAVIKTAGASSLLLTADAKSYQSGVFESADYLILSYSIDGGSWIAFFENRDDLQKGRVSHRIANTGSTLRIRIDAKTSASDETYEVDNLKVTDVGDPGPVECKESEGCKQIEPTGTSDDTTRIQNALNSLKPGDTLRLKGNFIYRDTLYLPSNFTWILDGTLTLAKNRSAQLDMVGIEIKEDNFNNKRATAIATRPGATGIDMSGGTYYGNGDFNKEKRVRLLNFVWAENSKFHDMVVEDASDDCFTLGHESRNNEVRNVIARYAGGKISRNGGNGLSDYGEKNKWYDCLAEDCGSDGWTPKCKNSHFVRCVARNNDGPGFGCYARLDGSAVSDNRATNIDGNKFIDILSYNNAREGISFNIADNSGPDATVRNNVIKGVFYNNGQFGVFFRNRTGDGIIRDNQVDILVFDNDALREDGSSSKLGAGLTAEGNVKRITGSIVGYDNANADIDLDDAENCSIEVYSPNDQSSAVIESRNSSNYIREFDFNCAQSPWDQYSVKAYCDSR